jgi:hypothetical protein
MFGFITSRRIRLAGYVAQIELRSRRRRRRM